MKNYFPKNIYTKNKSIILKITSYMLIFAMLFSSFIPSYSNDNLPSPYPREVINSEKNQGIKEKVLAEFSKEKNNNGFNPGKMLIKLKSISYIDEIKNEYGVELADTFGDGSLVRTLTLNEDFQSVEALMNSLNKDIRIEYAEPCYYVKPYSNTKVEPYKYNLWGLENEEYPGIDINFSGIPKKLKSSKEIVVGIIDSGIDYKHEDLKKSMWKNKKEIPGNKKDDDKNGYIDDIYGWDFSTNSNKPMDRFGHGTHVAGIIAAGENGLGVVGVAPKVKLMALKFLKDDGYGDTEAIAKAINYGVKKGVKIFNCSYGSPTFTATEYEAMKKNKDILFIAASGNDGINNDRSKKSYPACYGLPNILTVASINSDGSFSSFSNYGVKTVEIAAPGGDIFSTRPNGKYDYESGTSMAAPYVSATAALCLSVNPKLKAKKLKANILSSTHRLPGLEKKTKTGAILDAAGAIALSNKDYMIPLRSLEISHYNLGMLVGESQSITANISPSNATNSWITFQSSNPSVASVNSKGLVKAVTPGEAEITIKAGKLSKICKVIITDDPDKIYQAGETISINLPLPDKDALTGIAYFIKPNGERISVPVNYDEETRLSNIQMKIARLTNLGSLEIDSSKDYGEWEIDKLSMWNNKTMSFTYYLNEKYYDYRQNGYSSYNFDSYKFKITSPNGINTLDSQKFTNNILSKYIVYSPTVDSITINDNTFRSGGIIQIIVNVRSSVGIDQGSLLLTSPTGKETIFQLEPAPSKGYMYVNIGIDSISGESNYIDSTLSSGLWKLESIYLSEINGNNITIPGKKEFNVSKEVVAPQSINLSTVSVDLINSESRHILSYINPANTTDKTLLWYSSNPSVAVVDQRGIVTARGVGRCLVYARSKNYSNIISGVNVEVSAASTTSISKISGVINPKVNEINNTISFSVPHTTKKASPKLSLTKSGYWSFYKNFISEDDNGNSIAVKYGNNSTYIKIFAENGNIIKTYKVNIYKYPAPKKKKKKGA